MAYGYQDAQGVARNTGGNGEDFGHSAGYDPNAALLGRQKGFAERQANWYESAAGMADQRQAPLMDRTQDLQSRGYATEGIGMLGQRALGLGMSPGMAMAQRAGMDAQGAQMGMAMSARGGPAMQAMAARNASAQMQGIGTNTALQMQQLRAQEMDAARQRLFEATSGLRGQDIGQAQMQSDLNLQNRAANDQRSIQLYGMEQGTWENQRNALMAQQQMLLGDTAESQARLDRQAAANDEQQRRMTNMAVGTAQGALQGGINWAANSGGGTPQPRPNGMGIIRDNPYAYGNGVGGGYGDIYGRGQY
jgi:hypothetical protein